MKHLTEEAYNYAVRVKKVNEGVIEAYKYAYEKGYNAFKNLPLVEQLEIIKKNYRDSDEVWEDIGYSGGGRTPNLQEVKEMKKHHQIGELIEKIKEIDNLTQ